MKLSELIAAYGDDRVQFQSLDQCAIDLNMRGGNTRITFGTEQRLDPMKGTVKMGLIVWLDRDRVERLLAEARAGGEERQG